MAENSPITPTKLTGIEKFQTFKADRVTSPDTVAAVSWKIATQPLLYRELITFPFSQHSTEILSDKFPEASPADAVRALILAEPEGQYDQAVKQLPREERRKEYYKQINSSAEMVMRLTDYVSAHSQDFWEMNLSYIFGYLTTIAFGELDPNKIEQRYSQVQRRAVRLAVLNFIQDLQKLKPFKQEFTDAPKETAEKYLGVSFNGDVDVTPLPIGFVLELDEEDYVKLEPTDDEDKYFQSAGKVISSGKIPTALRWKIALIKKSGGKIQKTPEEIEKTRKHELLHIIFDSYFNDYMSSMTAEYWNNTVKLLHGVQDHLKFAQTLKRAHLTSFKDELIAYSSADKQPDLELKQHLGENFLANFKYTKEALQANQTGESNLPPLLYYKQYVNYFEQVAEYEWLVKKLYQKAGEHPDEILSTKIDALLQMTPIDRIRRLGGYLGIEPTDISKVRQREIKKTSKRFIYGIYHLTNDETPADTSQWYQFDNLEYKQLLSQHPKKILPTLLRAIPQASLDYFVEDCIEAVEIITFMNLTTLTPQKLRKVEDTLTAVIDGQTQVSTPAIQRKATEALQIIREAKQTLQIDPPEEVPA